MAAVYDLGKLAALGCVVRGGVVYSARGHAMCGVLNQYLRPCGRIGRCPFHRRASARVCAANAVNGALDAGGNLVGGVQRAREPREGEGAGKRGRARSGDAGRPEKLPYRMGWTREEHYLFLRGMERHGHGQWKEVSAEVRTRSATQVQSHAQKYFLRRKQRVKNKRSIHDLDLDSEELQAVAARLDADAAAAAAQAQAQAHQEQVPRGDARREQLSSDVLQEAPASIEADGAAAACSAQAHPEQAPRDDGQRQRQRHEHQSFLHQATSCAQYLPRHAAAEQCYVDNRGPSPPSDAPRSPSPSPLSESPQQPGGDGYYSRHPSGVSASASQQQAQQQVEAEYYFSRQLSGESGTGAGDHRAMQPWPTHDRDRRQNEVGQYSPQTAPQTQRYSGDQGAPPSSSRAAPLHRFGAPGSAGHAFVPGDRLEARIAHREARGEAMPVPPPHHSGHPEAPSFAFIPGAGASAQVRLENGPNVHALEQQFRYGSHPWDAGPAPGSMHAADLPHPHPHPYAARTCAADAAHRMDAQAHMTMSGGSHHAAMHQRPLHIEQSGSRCQYNVDVVAACGGGSRGAGADAIAGQHPPHHPVQQASRAQTALDGTKYNDGAVEVGGMDRNAYKYAHTPVHAPSDHHRQPPPMMSSYLTPSGLSAPSPLYPELGGSAGAGEDSASMTPGGVQGSSARTNYPGFEPGTFPSLPTNYAYPNALHGDHDRAVAVGHGGPSRAGGGPSGPTAGVRSCNTASVVEMMYFRTQSAYVLDRHC